ncbi:hypothetical protein BDFB_010441 [Asbolus verrucosus]|uniref:Uncharacterized protein n=1 Tax=Asbolus verrucosus TaxID=1661398 RepID=A0A482W3V1_ASBVE|nr:hypothetical protein BDFB_010441 [Asbolus verrucosus]
MPRFLNTLRSITSRISIKKDQVWQDFIEEKLPIFWIVGPALSGKTTLAHFLSDCSNYRLISLKHLVNTHAHKSTKFSSKTIVSKLKEEMKNTFRYCHGYILDDFPRNLHQSARFKKKICEPSVIICVTISLDGILGRALALHPTIDLNAVRIDYVVRSRFTEELYRTYQQRNNVIKMFSQFPIQETHNKVLEYLETDFGYKFR